MGAFALALAGGLGPVAPPTPDPPAVVIVVPAPAGKPIDFAMLEDFTRRPVPTPSEQVAPTPPPAVAPAKLDPPGGWTPPIKPDVPAPQATRYDLDGYGFVHQDAAYLDSWIAARNDQIRTARAANIVRMVAQPAEVYGYSAVLRRGVRRGLFGSGGCQ
jgi:hypothetical protein